jgi:NAD+ synthase
MGIKLEINAEIICEALTRFIKEEITRAGYSHAVVGVSGGVDSAVSTFLAARALGKENVWGLILPYRTSNPDSARHAKQVIEKAGVNSETVEITPMVDIFLDNNPDADNIRRGNMMARQRMIVLYDRSAKHQALVIGTGNKTECLLGYTTMWGDMACGINPLGRLYKTHVRQLARFLGVPDEIITKAPSADLWDGQTDEGELGFTYEEADKLLYLMVDKQLSTSELVDAGYDEQFIKDVSERIEAVEFKSRMPLVAEVPDGLTA